MALYLKKGELDLLAETQRHFLTEASEGGADEWQLRANRLVRELVGADHSVFILPKPGEMPPPFVTDDSPTDRLDDLTSYIRGVANGHYTVSDPWLEKAHRKRVEAGSGAYHLNELLSPDEQQASTTIQEIFTPAGMPLTIGLSEPLSPGEATQFFGYGGADAEARSERGVEILGLLVPSFSASIRREVLAREPGDSLLVALERIKQPVALVAQGRTAHRNRALRWLLEQEPESDRLAGAINALASEVGSWHESRNRGPLLRTPSRKVLLAGGPCSLTAVILPVGIGASVRTLVIVDPAKPALPPGRFLQERLGLTRRQAEVALLLAEGRTDREIAQLLRVKWHTARTHVRNVLSKLDLSSRIKVRSRLLSISVPKRGEE